MRLISCSLSFQSAATMFNFGRKKSEEKDKKRKEKKERHKKFLDGGSVMTQDELNRLSELSRKQSSSPEKLPSGITADYRLLTDNPDLCSNKSKQDQTSSDSTTTAATRSRPTSLTNTPPPLPERPPPKLKKSILKSSKSYDVSRSVSSELDDPQILLKNTKANEMFAYRKSLQQAAARASPVCDRLFFNEFDRAMRSRFFFLSSASIDIFSRG